MGMRDFGVQGYEAFLEMRDIRPLGYLGELVSLLECPCT